MTTHLVTFADDSMSRSAGLCVDSAKRQGVGRDFWITREMFQHVPTYKDNKALFDQPRGAGGYFAWKPYVLREAMLFCEDGDICIYADAGIEFIDNVNHIIDRMDQDIFLFGNQWEHSHWCKREIVEAIWPLSLDDARADPATDDDSLTFGDWWANAGWNRFGKQVQASVIFFRVNDNTRAFVKEWLDWCLFEGGRLIDDSPSRTPNHPEFQENRHDQAILTTMAYRDGIKLHWWPAQYNDGAFIYERGDYPDEGYPVLVHHHRRRNHEWKSAA